MESLHPVIDSNKTRKCFVLFFGGGGGVLFVCLFVFFSLHCSCFVYVCFCTLKLPCGVNKKKIKIKSGFRVVGC